MEYIYTDKRSKNKSIAVWEGQQVEFWYSLFDKYTQDEVEAYIKAEALLALGREDEINAIIQPFVSGTSTYEIKDIVNEDGELTTVEVGADNRSFLKRWQDENIN